MSGWLLLIGLIFSSATEIRVEVLDQPIVKANAIESISRDSIRVVTSSNSEPVKISRDKLLRLTLTESPIPPLDAPWIELCDGSILPVDTFEVSDEVAKFRVRGQSEFAELQLDQIHLVRFQPRTSAIDVQWKEVLKNQPPADLLVIRKKSDGKEAVIDFMEGILGNVTANEVYFSLDGDTVPVPKAKLDGLYYYRKNKAVVYETDVTIKTLQGMRVVASEIEKTGDELKITCRSGASFSIRFSDLAEIDASRGKIEFLSDLRPYQVKKERAIDLPETMRLVDKLHGPLFDRGFFSPKIKISANQENSSNLFSDSLVFEKGIGLRPKTEITYRIPDKFSRLQATMGIDEEAFENGSVRLRIQADEEVLYDEIVLAGKAPVELNLLLEKHKYLKIIVEDAEDGDLGDRLYLCNARFTK